MSDGDPEDWPAHPVELRQLERSLRCQICQDVYQGPVSLTCGHTFCSMCIRSTLSVFSKEGRQQACPTCREAADVTHLRPIQHLRDASAAWKAVRQLLLLQHLQAVDQQQPQVVEALVVHQQQRQAGQQQHKDLGNGKSLRRQTRRPSRTPPLGAVSRQVSGSSRQVSGNSRGRQKTPEPAITISSTGGGGSQRVAADALDTSEDEVASVQQDSDPDWSAEDADQQRQRQGPAAVQPTSKRRLRNSSTSMGIDASPLAADADAADSDGLRSDDESDFEPAELPAPKRARAAVQQPGPGKENRSGPAAVQQQQPAQAGSSAPHQQQQAQQRGYVACPICSSSVKEKFINSHIDTCLAKMPSGEQQQQRSAGRASTTAGKRPAAEAALVTKPRVSVPHPVPADAVANGSNIPGGSSGSKLASGRLITPAGGVGGSSSGGGGVRRARVKALEPPPKLCFDLMKDKELKGKLTQLGLSSEGGKKVCAQRYTSFRNYVLALQDSGANMTQKEAAADFTRGERKHARAAPRPVSVAALAGAAGPASAAAGAAAAGQRSGSRGPDDRSIGPDLGVVDNSYATLIHQTKERMAQRKQQAEQQEQQHGPEQHQQEELSKEDAPETAAQTSLQQQDMPQQQDQPSQLDQLERQEAYTADADRLTDDLQQHDRGVPVVVTAGQLHGADTEALKQQQLAVVAAALDACTAVPCVAMESDCYQGLVVPDSDDGL